MTGMRRYGIMLSAISAVMGVAPATAQDVAPTERLYIVSGKPPSVAVVDLGQLKVTGSIPLDPEPQEAVLDPTDRFLYVRHGPFDPRDKSTKGKIEQVTIVDVQAGTVVEKVRLGQNTDKLALSPDGNLLFCFSRGHDIGNYWYTYNPEKLKPEQCATVVIVDTRRAAVVARYSAGSNTPSGFFAPAASRVALLQYRSGAWSQGRRLFLLSIFAIDQQKLLAEVPVSAVDSQTLSSDERWLYVRNYGNPSKNRAKHKNGTVSVIDLREGRLVATHDVGVAPDRIEVWPDTDVAVVVGSSDVRNPRARLWRLRGSVLESSVDVDCAPSDVRLARRPGETLVMTHRDIRRWPDTDGLDPWSSSFAAPVAPGSKTPRFAGASGTALAGDPVFLHGGSRMAFQLYDPKTGYPLGKVQLHDLSGDGARQEVQLPYRRPGFWDYMGDALAGAALATAPPVVQLNTIVSYNLSRAGMRVTQGPLIPAVDGKQLWVLNPQHTDFLILDAKDGSIVDTVALQQACEESGLTPDGRFVYAVARGEGGELDLIDVASRKKLLEYKLKGEAVRGVSFDAQEGRIVVLGRESLLVFDLASGTLAGRVEGLKQSLFMVPAHRPRPGNVGAEPGQE